MLTDNILTAIDENEVEPTFGPLRPTSKFARYNPITGDIAVEYRFSYYVLSGGQTVTTIIELVCDSGRTGGKYCPEGRTYAKDLNSRARISPLVTREGELKSTPVTIYDDEARYKYNVMEVTHKYTIDGKLNVKGPFDEPISELNSIFAQCRMEAGIFGSNLGSDSDFGVTGAPVGGITCDSYFTDESALSRYQVLDSSRIIPNPRDRGTPTLYSGNKVIVDANFDIRPNSEGDQDNFKLHYMFDCRTVDGGGQSEPASVPVNINSLSKLVYIDEIPELNVLREFKSATSRISSVSGLENYKVVGIEVSYIPSYFTDSAPSFTVNSIQVGGPGSDIQIGAVESGSVISFDSKKTIRDISTHALLIQINGKLESGSFFTATANKEIKLKLSTVPSDGVFFKLKLQKKSEPNDKKELKFNSVISQSGTGTPLANVKAGTCKVNLRLLPESELSDLTRDNFFNYSTLGEDIETNVVFNDVITKTFNIAPSTRGTEENQIFSFELARPLESKTFCINPNREEITNLAIDLIIPATSSQEGFEYNKETRLIVNPKTIFPSTGYFKLRIAFDKQKFPEKNIVYNNQIIDSKESKFKYGAGIKENQNLGYYGKIGIKNYKLPDGTDFEDATIYLTYLKGNNVISTDTKTIRFQTCEEGSVSKNYQYVADIAKSLFDTITNKEAKPETTEGSTNGGVSKPEEGS